MMVPQSSSTGGNKDLDSAYEELLARRQADTPVAPVAPPPPR